MGRRGRNIFWEILVSHWEKKVDQYGQLILDLDRKKPGHE